MLETRKIILKCIFLCILFFAGILVGLFLWERIELPFENPWEVMGTLASIRYNPTNDLIRFIVFISLPTVLLFAIYLVNNKRLNDLCFSVSNDVRICDHTISLSPLKRTIPALCLVIVAILVGIAVTTFGSSYSFDTFHEGETLGPALSYMKGKIPYRDCLFWHGVFQDPLRSVIAFKLFGKSIGAVRTFDSILKILQIVLCAFFLRKIYRGNYLYVALTFIALIIFYNLIYSLDVVYVNQIASRDIITFCFLLAIPLPQGSLNNRNNDRGLKKLFIRNYLLSFIAIASFGYSIDRGFFLCATFLILSPIIYIVFFRKHSFHIYYLVSSLLGLLSGFLVLGYLLQGSFSEFFEFTFMVVPRYKDLLDGQVYPITTLAGLACATLLAVNTYWVTLKFLQTVTLNDKEVMPAISAFLEKYLIELCLLLLSIIMFRSALGRSGMGRVAYYSYLPYILFVYIVIKHYINELLQRPGYRVKCSYGAGLVIILFAGYCVYHIYSNQLIANNFPFMVKDSQLIPKHYKATIAFLKNNLKSEDEFFTMTSEGCWYYFIDKACPTRFPVVGFAATNFYQQEVVEDLKKSRVKFILYKNNSQTNTLFGFTSETRLPVITDYIRQDYTLYRRIEGNELWINAENLSNQDQENIHENGIGNLYEPSLLEYHWLEAEEADSIRNPLQVAKDDSASEGKFIYAPNGTRNKYFPSSIMATYTVHISQAGEYILLGRIKGIGGRDDSFFVQIDDGSNNLWEIEAGNYWHWDAVNARRYNDPVVFSLTEGTHKIKVKLREDGTKLDKLLLTNNADFFPRGEGDAAENSGYSEGN